jgi:hypothetical protein
VDKKEFVSKKSSSNKGGASNHLHPSVIRHGQRRCEGSQHSLTCYPCLYLRSAQCLASQGLDDSVFVQTRCPQLKRLGIPTDDLLLKEYRQ